MRRAALLAALLLAACSSLESERAVDRIQAPIAAPSWSGDIAPVLRETCGSSGACHGGATPQRDLRLEGTDAAMYAQVVNVPSQIFGSYMRVRPGQPDSSFLLLLLSESLSVRLGNRRMPMTYLPLPQPVRITIRNWIQNGAPSN
jgi:hypothetical protein